MTDIESRVFSGAHEPADVEWMTLLDEIFRDVTLPGFAEAGVSVENTRRLIALMAMARKARNETGDAA